MTGNEITYLLTAVIGALGFWGLKLLTQIFQSQERSNQRIETIVDNVRALSNGSHTEMLTGIHDVAAVCREIVEQQKEAARLLSETASAVRGVAQCPYAGEERRKRESDNPYNVTTGMPGFEVTSP